MMSAFAFIDEAQSTLAQNSTRAVYAAALVLTLAMLSFCVDLAQAPGRQARAGRRGAADEAAVEAGAESAAEADEATSAGVAATSTASVGGATAVLERTRERRDLDGDGTPDVPADGHKRQWAGTGMALTWLGAAFLIAGIVMRSLAVHRPPLGNMYEFDLAGTAFLLVCFLLWSLRKDVRWLGAFVTLPATLFLILAAKVYYTEASKLMPSLQSYWLSIHVTVATLSVGLFTIGFVITCLYLAQKTREEKGKSGGFLRSLPDSETLDRLSYGVHIIAFPLWMFTVLCGAIWAQEAWGHYWNWDPKEVWSLVIFIVYAAYLHSRVTVGWSGRKAAAVVLVGFACILINYGVVNVFFVGQHSYSGL